MFVMQSDNRDKAIPDYDNSKTLPDWLDCDGWHSSCGCGQREAWFPKKTPKHLFNAEQLTQEVPLETMKTAPSTTVGKGASLNLTGAYSTATNSPRPHHTLRECDFCEMNPSNQLGGHCPGKERYLNRDEAIRVRHLRSLLDGSAPPGQVTTIQDWPGHSPIFQPICAKDESERRWQNMNWEEAEAHRFSRQ